MTSNPTLSMNCHKQKKTDWALIALLGIALCLSMMAGCGDGRPHRAPVSGRVTIDGKPLETGYIQVIPDKNRAAGSKIESDGHFSLTTFNPNDGCVLGKHPVTVIAKKDLNSTTVQWLAPKKYGNVATSGLTIEVNGPTNDVEIKLSWEGGKPFVERFEAESRPQGRK